jgi:hypothetical protein
MELSATPSRELPSGEALTAWWSKEVQLMADGRSFRQPTASHLPKELMMWIAPVRWMQWAVLQLMLEKALVLRKALVLKKAIVLKKPPVLKEML